MGYGSSKFVKFLSFVSIDVLIDAVSIFTVLFISKFEGYQEMDILRLPQGAQSLDAISVSSYVQLLVEPPEHRRLSHTSHG